MEFSCKIQLMVAISPLRRQHPVLPFPVVGVEPSGPLPPFREARTIRAHNVCVATAAHNGCGLPFEIQLIGRDVDQYQFLPWCCWRVA